MNKHILYVLLLFLLSCENKPAEKRNIEKIPQGAIPINYYGYILAQGSIDTIKGNFIIDTGTDKLFLDDYFYHSNKFTFSNFVNRKIWGIGNSSQDIIVINDTINLMFNKQKYKSSVVPILELKPVGGDFVDGLIGWEFFSKDVLKIDYFHEFIQVFNDIDSIDISGYKMILMTQIDKHLFIPLIAKINKDVIIEGIFMIDIGSYENTLTSFIAKKYQLDKFVYRKNAYYTKNGGIGGESSGYDFISETLQISDFTFNDVSISYSLDSAGSMASDAYCGILGNSILEHFDVIFDFKNKKLYLKPNSNFDNPFEVNQLGFFYVDRYKTMGGWIVNGISKNSHAEKQGLKIDDKIISVNGIPVEKISYKAQRNYFDKLDEAEFIINRNDTLKTIKIKIAPLL